MKIALVCAGGMSTSMLVARMRKAAEEDDVIEAYGYKELDEFIDDYDIVLVGPQIAYDYDVIEAKAKEHGKKVRLITPQAFGSLDGKTILDLAKEV